MRVTPLVDVALQPSIDGADNHTVARSPADVVASPRSQLERDDQVGDELNRTELARVEGAAAMLAAALEGADWPRWVDPPQGRRSPRASELTPDVLERLLEAHSRRRTWQGVADELNEAGITGPRGGRWRAQAVKVVVQGVS